MGFRTSVQQLTDKEKAAMAQEITDKVLNDTGSGIAEIAGAKSNIDRIVNNDYLSLYRDGKIYGCKYPVASYSGAPTGEHTGAAVGLTAQASTDTTAGVNDFDSVPCFRYDSVNGYLDNDNQFHTTAVEGDLNFARDGSNGDCFSRFQLSFFRYYVDGNYEYFEISDTWHKGFCPFGIFIKPDGGLRNYAYIAQYEMGYNDDTFCASISGVPVAHNTYANRNATTAGLSHNSQLTEFRKKGAQYCGMTTKDIAFLQHLFIIEFATKNSQSIMQGATNFNYQKPLSVAETGVSRVIVSNANAAYYPVGCTVSVSKSGMSNAPDRNNAVCHTTVNRKVVLSKEVYDDNNTVINLDTGGATFDTVTTMYISTMPWNTGMTDSILGSSGNYINNSGYYPMKYRGIENMYGNTCTIISDVICIAYQPYICYDCTKFSTNTNAYYEQTNYTVSETSNSFVKALGYDAAHPSVRVPITVGGSGTTYYCDNYWITNGTNEFLFGGSVGNGMLAGAWYWNLSNVVSSSHWSFAARLSVSGRSGILAA